VFWDTERQWVNTAASIQRTLEPSSLPCSDGAKQHRRH
jgi:hypothetical protein